MILAGQIKGASIMDVRTLGKEGVRNNGKKVGMGREEV